MADHAGLDELQAHIDKVAFSTNAMLLIVKSIYDENTELQYRLDRALAHIDDLLRIED